MSTTLYCDDCYDDDEPGEYQGDDHEFNQCIVLFLLCGLLIVALELGHGC